MALVESGSMFFRQDELDLQNGILDEVAPLTKAWRARNIR